MALCVCNKGFARRAEWPGELDLKLDLMMGDDLIAAGAGGVTPAAAECPATEEWR
jgi:hypothetical protein